MNGELRVYDTTDELFAAAAATFVDAARSVLTVRPRFTVALAGGTTPQALYERLTTTPYRDRIDWRKVEWFWGDERAVGPDDPESNYRLARDALLSHIDVEPAAIHRLRGEVEPSSQAAVEYERELARVFGVPLAGPPPSIDLVLLGLGSDGHTASLFPYTAALNERRRWVVADDVPQLHAQRLTMTYPLLNAAACVLFLVTGAGKSQILREVLEGPHDPRRLPSQAIRPVGGRLLWLVDRAAASQLE